MGFIGKQEKKMKTKTVLFVVIIIAILSSSAWAGPFGLRMGMTLKELGPNEKLNDGIYRLTKVPVPHDRFFMYIAFVSPKQGLFRIDAITPPIRTDIYGDNIKGRYEDTKDSLTKKYGFCRSFDYLKDGSIWNEPKDFTMALLKSEYLLGAIWDRNEGANLPDNLESIGLKVECSSPDFCGLRLEYYFVNHVIAVEEILNKNDGAL